MKLAQGVKLLSQRIGLQMKMGKKLVKVKLVFFGRHQNQFVSGE